MPSVLNHIFLPNLAEESPFTSNQQRGGENRIPSRDRASHSQRLESELNQIWDRVNEIKIERDAISIPVREGTYLEFESQIDHDLTTKSLEDIRQGVRLLNVRERQEGDDRKILATVFVPNGKEDFFIKKIRAYASEDSPSGRPKNQDLINSIEGIRLALLESLWTDKRELIPQEDPRWCEVWLRAESSNSQVVTQFTSVLDQLRISKKPNFISFPERIVVLIYVDYQKLSELLEATGLIAEIRIGQETAGFWVGESSQDQAGWIEDLVSRLELDFSSTCVCILDTGVNNAHRLLSPVLTDGNCLSVLPEWGTHDHYSERGGHGTLMAGLAVFGNLESKLSSSANIVLRHDLCSVKLLPPHNQPQTPPELWGDFTSRAISIAEIANPDKTIIYCMAVTATIGSENGKPSSWSGAIDNLAYGEISGNKKLLIISAGNITDPNEWLAYPDSNLISSVQNPAQSWNALTVGAFTELTAINDPDYQDHTPLASSGCLSPFSSTSYTWPSRWPFKPDVVFEGGNLLKSPDETIVDGYEDFSSLSTSKDITIRQFDLVNATSAATAKASSLAAEIAASYPDAWPETIRAIIIHSAKWSEQIIAQFNLDLSRKNHVANLLKICGYGTPNEEFALNSSQNNVMMISQAEIQPFEKVGSRYKTKEMHFYQLPWPREELLEMGEIPVKLKITLSYFVEPGPGEIGWKDKYRYQSYGLRFDLNSEAETEDDFKRRINAAARDDDESSSGDSGSNRWVIGSRGRSSGSVHSDIWEGTAAQMASCNLLAIYPIIGWWRQRTNLRKYDSRTRYSLVVSLETPSLEVDLYTPIVNQISIPITIENN